MRRPLFLAALLLVPTLLPGLAAAAQTPAPSAAAQTAPPPPPPQKPESPHALTTVNPDDTVTFRYTNGTAKTVDVSTDATPKPLPMTLDAATGVWSVTTPVLAPEHYGYSFVVDGVGQLDPLNHHVRPNLVSLSSDLLVPATPPRPWQLQAIPHGELTLHVFTTQIAKNLPENQSAYVVYTPPGYDAHRKGGYPVLYLLHGWSDTEQGWPVVGEAGLLLDSMIQTGGIVPMVVVMPLGYGDFTFVTSGPKIWSDPTAVDRNTSLDEDMLLHEVMPAVHREYNIKSGRDAHAIAGLSMGGLESLTIGLQHPEVFAYVGGFSAAVHGRHFDEHFPALAAGPDAGKKADLKLLWVACGTGDGLYQPNQEFIAWARTKGLPVTPISTPGQHTWLVWRDNLLHFAPLLFR